MVLHNMHVAAPAGPETWQCSHVRAGSYAGHSSGEVVKLWSSCGTLGSASMSNATLYRICTF